MRKKPQDSKKSSLTTDKEASRRVLKKNKRKKILKLHRYIGLEKI